MSQGLSSQISYWLKQLKIPVSKKYLRRQLLSHPDYPSLLSITDTLDELNIENVAIETGKEHLHEVPVPFLAHLKSNNGEFVIVKCNDQYDRQFPNFFERWSGVVLLTEKPKQWRHEENNKWIRKEKQGQRRLIMFIGFLSVFIIISALFAWQWQQVVLLFIASAGIFTSWLIVGKDLGIENKIADHVCGKQVDCDAVIKSKGAKLPLGINWSDVGMIWFSFLLLSLMIFSFAKTTADFYLLLIFLSTCSVPFTLFSVYYQWRIAKKWCRLCLMIIVLLGMQLLILIPELEQAVNSRIYWNNVTLSGLLFFCIGSTWFAIKSLLKKNKRFELENLSNLRLKNDPDIFTSVLRKQRKVDTARFDNDLQIGNPDDDIQIIVAGNPYCGPCAKAHQVLQKLAEEDNIGLTVRFALKTGSSEDRKLKAAEYLLQLAYERKTIYKRKMLHEWYGKMDLEEFIKKYPLLISVDIKDQLKRHEEWSNKSGISFTPTIFINGYELPKQYMAQDLKRLIKSIEKNKPIGAENN